LILPDFFAAETDFFCIAAHFYAALLQCPGVAMRCKNTAKNAQPNGLLD